MDWTDPGAPQLPERNWAAKIKNVEDLPKNGAEVIVDGLWHRQEVLLLGGHAKSWKSWALMDLNFCIANGLGWLGWSGVNQGKVLHIDFELFEHEIRQRYQAIAQVYGKGSLNNVAIISLRGESFDPNDFSLLGEQILKSNYLAVSFDPSYRLLAGQNESDPVVVTDLMNRALIAATTLDAGMSLLHHFSKGSQSDKRDLDSFSGSSVWGRAPDSLLTFREHEDEKCYTVSTNLRHWPNIDPFVVQFDYPLFKVQQSKDPEDLKRPRPGRHQVAFSVESLCNLIENDEYISYSNLLRRSNAANASKRTFIRRLKEAKDKGYIASNPADSTYFLTAGYVSKFRLGANGASISAN